MYFPGNFLQYYTWSFQLSQVSGITMGPIFLRFIETKYIVRGQTGMDQGLKSRFINAEFMR